MEIVAEAFERFLEAIQRIYICFLLPEELCPHNGSIFSHILICANSAVKLHKIVSPSHDACNSVFIILNVAVFHFCQEMCFIGTCFHWSHADNATDVLQWFGFIKCNKTGWRKM